MISFFKYSSKIKLWYEKWRQGGEFCLPINVTECLMSWLQRNKIYHKNCNLNAAVNTITIDKRQNQKNVIFYIFQSNSI